MVSIPPQVDPQVNIEDSVQKDNGVTVETPIQLVIDMSRNMEQDNLEKVDGRR